MNADRALPRLPLALFALLLPAVYAAEALVVSSSPLLARAPDLGAAAVTFDLVLFVPLLCYLLVIRPAGLSPLYLAPVYLLSLFGASRVLPDAHQQYLRMAELLAIPAEVGLVGYVGVRAGRALRRAGGGGDLLDRLRSAAREVIPSDRAARAVAHEIAFLHYALFAWRSRPEVGEGETAFSYHRESGYAGIMLAVGMAGVVEAVGIHLLVHRWSATAAWVLTGLSLYGLVWLTGHFQAVRLRPILLTPAALVVRIGLLWSVRIPYGRIAALHPADSTTPTRSGPGYLHAVAMGPARLVVELVEPVEVEGVYGFVKRGVSRIGVAVDGRGAFEAELRRRVELDRL